jgi:hypothetical protein
VKVKSDPTWHTFIEQSINCCPVFAFTLTSNAKMFRQIIRPSIRPIMSRSSLPRTQQAARACHTHSFKRSPRSSSHRCAGLYVPIQTSTVFLQLGQPCPSGCPHYSYLSSRSFHTTRRVEAVPFGVLAALKVRFLQTVNELRLDVN